MSDRGFTKWVIGAGVAQEMTPPRLASAVLSTTATGGGFTNWVTRPAVDGEEPIRSEGTREARTRAARRSAIGADGAAETAADRCPGVAGGAKCR